MNLLSLGLRNLLGVLLPGAHVVVVLLSCVALLVPGMRDSISRALNEKSWLMIVAGFLASYIVGSVIRLYAADTVDRLSAWLIHREGNPFRGTPETVKERLKTLLADVVDLQVECPADSKTGNWALAHDWFPYPIWECMKFRLYHPPEMFAFYERYKDCFAVGNRRGKEFFNYCKAVVFSANEGKRHALSDEVQAAEANVRFFAGTFWAVSFSVIALLATAILLGFERTTPTGAIPMVTAAGLLMALIAYAIVADGRFRLMRLKEVDTVFDAFYLVNRQAGRCPDLKQTEVSRNYLERRDLVESAFSPSGGVSLQQLVALMKLRSHNNPLLSSLYFAGAERDHPFFLSSDRVAVGISVLPEDEPKSMIAKRHPHQTEAIVVLDGELCLDVVSGGNWRRTEMVTGQVKIVLPGECHRILSKGKTSAAFLFVKTHPAEEPRGEFCTENHPGSADQADVGG